MFEGEYLTQQPPDRTTLDEKPQAEFMFGGGIEMGTHPSLTLSDVAMVWNFGHLRGWTLPSFGRVPSKEVGRNRVDCGGYSGEGTVHAWMSGKALGKTLI